MSNEAQSWAWKQNCGYSSDKGVLVALADNAWEDGSNAWPSVALLTRKTGLSRRTVQASLRRLVANSFIQQTAEADPGRAKPTTYRVCMDRDPAQPLREVAQPRRRRTQDASAEIAPGGATDDLDPAQLSHPPRAAVAPEPSKNPKEQPSELLPATKVAAKLTDGQRINEITKAYVEAEPLSNFPAIRQIVSKAFKTGEFADNEIREALLRLAGEGRSVTTNSLRIELRGYPGPRRDIGGLTPRNAANAAVVQHFAQLEAQGEIA